MIGDLRRALASRVSADEFDHGLRRLRDAGALVFELVPAPLGELSGSVHIGHWADRLGLSVLVV